MPFGPDSSELEADLARIDRRLRAPDSAVSPQACELRHNYYTHRRNKLLPQILRLTLKRRVQSCERDVQQKREALRQILRNATKDEIHAAEAEKECNQAEKVLTEARDELDARSSSLVDLAGESWEVVTSPALLPAVAHVRGDFEESTFWIRNRAAHQCFKELHPVAAGKTEPAVFRKHFWDCIEKLREVVSLVFARFLEISLAQKGTIGKAPVEWAALQLRDLIDRDARLVNHWVKSVCDEPDHALESLDLKTPEEIFFRTDWRAPKWLHMRPNGNAPYDASTAWSRQDEATTKHTLKALREDRWVLSLDTGLDVLVGVTHEVLAKQKPHDAKTGPTRRKPTVSSKHKTRRDAAFFAAIQANLQGLKYCRFVDEQGVHPLADWVSQGCAETYAGAYRQGEPWRKKIQDQKNKAKRRFENTPPTERERLIQSLTRPTRS